MTDDEKLKTMTEGFDILCTWSRNIAMLPLEDWWNALERAESFGAILDPTLYRKYIWSKKADFLKKLIEAAIPLKKLVLEAQPMVREEIEKGREKT